MLREVHMLEYWHWTCLRRFPALRVWHMLRSWRGKPPLFLFMPLFPVFFMPFPVQHSPA